MSAEVARFDFVVVGGGIAAVSCVEQIMNESPSASTAIVSAGPLVKAATNACKAQSVALVVESS